MATITTRQILSLGTDQEFDAYEVKAVLSSAELLGLAATPIVMVDGVAGEAYWVKSVFVRYLAGATPYTVPVGGTLSIGPGSGPLGSLLPAEGFLDQAAPQIATGIGSGSGDAADIIGDDLRILLNEAITAGDGTLEVTVEYRVVDTP